MQFSIGNICQALVIPTEKSFLTIIWSLIELLWPWYWLIITILIGLWFFYEIKTRNGTAHYNSENGYSPIFNSFVGSGTYFFLQGFVYLSLKLIIGEGAYCLPLPYIIHLIVFLSTGKILHAVGFWPRLEKPRNKRKKRWRKRKY